MTSSHDQSCDLLSHVVSSVQDEEVAKIAEAFPFTKYFETAPQPLFKGNSHAEDLDIAEVGVALSHDCHVTVM